ncbi:MAG TPA: pitrilysin family protein [Anaerolineaceae bacterium]|nr:pitrilysin family protein [Anaerolineaceae bacterium]
MTNIVTKTRLDNGITLHLKEIHTAPIISHWIWYRVGSRDEVPGKTGISHWVEHMQFKGTPRFPAGVMDKAISRDGGFWNAFTYLDWTAFFETLPADSIDLAYQLEADRMVNSSYDPSEVDSERTVIISEREGSENEPMFRLGEAVQLAAFKVHPYHHEIIGEKEDLHRIQRDDLYHHYRSYYVPNNAVVAVAGDFEMQTMLEKLSQLYGKIPPGPTTQHPAQPEPPLDGEKRLEVKGPGETTFLQLAYRAPSAADPDFFGMTVVDSLLTGPTGLNMFGGGGISNKTSRLYRALVERELAISVNGGMQATIDPFLYDITITVDPRQKVETNLAILDGEIRRLQDEPVSPAEIARAIKQARALFAYGSENITNQAFWLGYAEMFANYDWFVNYVEELEKINPVDVQRIAQTYLSSDNRVVGTYIPTGDQGENE